jgi:hypothetical protein
MIDIKCRAQKKGSSRKIGNRAVCGKIFGPVGKRANRSNVHQRANRSIVLRTLKA